MGRILVLALCLLASPTLAAGYTKPAGTPEVYLPGYNVTVGVWAVATAIGQGIGVFENKGDINGWTLCGQCLVEVSYPTLDTDVAAAGGPAAYVAAKVPAVNAFLARRYPPSGTAPVTVLDQVNQALATSYKIGVVNGSPVLGAK